MKGELIAWRAWKLDKDNRLTSVSHGTVWEGPTLTADEKPAKSNHNGLWCYKHRKVAMAHVGDHAVIGSVALTGRVVEHTKGFRAETMTIQSLEVLDDRNDQLCDELQQRYQCDVANVKRPAWAAKRGGVLAALRGMFSWGTSQTLQLSGYGDTWYVPLRSNLIILQGDARWISAPLYESSTWSPSPTPQKFRGSEYQQSPNGFWLPREKPVMFWDVKAERSQNWVVL